MLLGGWLRRGTEPVRARSDGRFSTVRVRRAKAPLPVRSFGVLTSLSLVIGVVGLIAPAGGSVAFAAGRAADSAGSAAIGTASYAAPAGAIYVSTSGSDGNAGTLGSPVRSLARALVLAPASGTVVLRSGSYNESVVLNKTVTIQNYPGEAVWMDGSTGVTGWVQDGSRWRRDGWTTRFDHSPTYTKGAPDSTTPHWQFLNSSYPMAAHPDQVWINGVKQKQVASLAQVVAGSFYLDEGSSRLYIGSNPSGAQVSASNVIQAMNVRAAGVVVRGIGIRRYAPSVWHVGAITIERPSVVFENVVVADAATTGISIQSTGAQFRKVTVEGSGMLGVNGRYADNMVMTDFLARANNSERFNIAPVSGGVKLGVTRGVTVTNSSFRDNYGPGFWEDMSIYNSVFRSSNFTGNAGDGLFLEISARVVVGDSLFANNRWDGIKVNNTSNVKIWNNTFVGNGRPLDLVQDARRNTNPSDPGVDSRIAWPDPEMPWQLGPVTVSNNVVGLSTSVANCLLCVEDYSYKESGQAMGVKANGNVYVRTSASSPTWLALWSRAPTNVNPYTLTTLDALRSATGEEARGREYTGTTSSVLAPSGALASSVQDIASSIALPLPSDVAAQLGQPSGSLRLGTWSGTTAPPPPPPPPPVDPVEPPATVLARDYFERSVAGGWGSAEVGGRWTTPAMPERFSVSGGAGQVNLKPGDGFSARLDAVSSTKSDARVAFSINQAASGAGHFVSLIARSTSGGDYRAKVGIAANGAVSLWVSKVAGGSEVVLNSQATGLNYKVGDTLLVRVQATGTNSTTVRAKVWKGGTTEPSTWNLSSTDGTAALQVNGAVGLYAYSTGSISGAATTLYFDAFQVGAS